MGSRSMFVAVALVVAAVVLASSIGAVPSGSTTTVTPGQTTVSAASVNGLRLSLEISKATIQQGSAVAINVSERNTNAPPLNESAAADWAVSGLRMAACYDSIYPFGVAIYQGHYTSQNASAGTPLNLYPFLPCPLAIRYISGYDFHGSSDVAQVLPGSGPGVAMASGVTAQGNYTADGLTNFVPGQYTVVAGDEWGALAFLYFIVH
jgi:hypothetical protein